MCDPLYNCSKISNNLVMWGYKVGKIYTCTFMMLNINNRLLVNLSLWIILYTGPLTCPWLNQMASTTPSTALSKSADSNTTTGDFPPSSSDSFLPLPAVRRRSVCPTCTWNKTITSGNKIIDGQMVWNV